MEILKRFQSTKPKHQPFYVIIEDNGQFGAYDVMPYFLSEYKELQKRAPQELPQTAEQWHKWFENTSMYQFWSRCQYEVILSDWPCQQKTQKIDIHEQLMMNKYLVIRTIQENVEFTMIGA